MSMRDSQEQSADVLAAARDWLAAFGQALRVGDPVAAVALFSDSAGGDCHWRDLFAFGWSLNSVSGRDAIGRMLALALPRVQPRDVRLAPAMTAPRRVVRAGEQVIEAMFELETQTGTVTGVARLRPDADGPGGVRAWIVMTGLSSIRGHEERSNHHQRSIHGDDYYAREFGGENWLDKHRRALAFEDRDPAVLVVGAGQAGLSAAARLAALGIDTLVIDREARVGDNWRSRYHSLTLHNEVHVNHLPYMPFPQNWPVFIPKDKLANWFESYVDALDLLCWTGTELTGGHYDEAAGHWVVTLRRADGQMRVMRPRHLVFGTGVSAIAADATLPGLDTFAGTVMHSGRYTQGAAWRGRHAVVIGTGNSGHDIAQDLHASGARVTMVQRSPTHVVGIREAQRVYSIYAEGLPTDECDLLATAMPYPVLVRAYRHATAMSRQAEAPLREALAARGFRLTDGEDETGFQMMYLRRGGGYYFNVGCSELIASGEVSLLDHDELDAAEARGLRLRDGRLLEADLIVTATGFLGQDEVVRRALGSALADRAGPVWGLDAQGELRNMWRPTGQPGLWFIAGSLAQCRIWSKYLALQIQARELGLVQ